MATKKILKCLRCCNELPSKVKYLCEPCSLVMDWRAPQPTPTSNSYGTGIAQRWYVSRTPTVYFDEPSAWPTAREQIRLNQIQQLYESLSNPPPTPTNQENIRYSSSNLGVNLNWTSLNQNNWYTVIPF